MCIRDRGITGNGYASRCGKKIIAINIVTVLMWSQSGAELLLGPLLGAGRLCFTGTESFVFAIKLMEGGDKSKTGEGGVIMMKRQILICLLYTSRCV